MSPASPGRAGLAKSALDHFLTGADAGESLRSTAAALGVSHSLLLYHFGGRDGLLAAVRDACEQRLRADLTGLRTDGVADVPRAMWRHLADPKRWPLYRLGFLLRAKAGDTDPEDRPFWLDALEPVVIGAGVTPSKARNEALLWLATARGLLWELVCGADPAAVDRAAECLFSRYDR